MSLLGAQSCQTLCNPLDCSPPGSSFCPWNFPGRNTGLGCHVLLQGLPNPGIKPVSLVSPALAGELFTASATWEVRIRCLYAYHLNTCVRMIITLPQCVILYVRMSPLLSRVD